MGIRLELRQFQFFPELVPEPEPQSCSAKRASTITDSTVESVPAAELAPRLESVPNVESAPEYDTQFLDRYNYPLVRKKTEYCQNILRSRFQGRIGLS